MATTLEEIETLRAVWERVQWGSEEAEFEHFVACSRARLDGETPLALVLRREDAPVAALAGRIFTRTVGARFGYRTLYAPRMRLLHVVEGGIVWEDPAAFAELACALTSLLRAGVAEVVSLPSVPTDSDSFRALCSLGGPLERARFNDIWDRQLLTLPDSFEDYLDSRSRKTRFGIRYDERKLVASLGNGLRMDVCRSPTQAPSLIRDLAQVSRRAHQSAHGGGFLGTPEQREITSLGLKQGSLQAYVLYHDTRPIAYWICTLWSDTRTLRLTGYDQKYAKHRVGIYLLMRVIEDSCADPAVRVLDFGPGRTDYKGHFSGETRQEAYLTLFAPTLRARRIQLIRLMILGTAVGARKLLDAMNLTERVKVRRAPESHRFMRQ